MGTGAGVWIFRNVAKALIPWSTIDRVGMVPAFLLTVECSKNSFKVGNEGSVYIAETQNGFSSATLCGGFKSSGDYVV